VLKADTPLKSVVDHLMPRTGFAVLVYFGAIVGMLAAAPLFPKPGELGIDGLAAAAAALWCGLNFWRCRQAHCLVTVAGWSILALFTFVEAGIGRSMVHGDEQLAFLAVLIAGLLFEAVWYLARGTNAVAATREQMVT
jgi:hypothetical protein